MLEPFDVIIRIFNSSVRTHVLTPDDHIESIFARGLSKRHLNSKSIAPSKAMVPFPFFRRLNNIFFHRIRRSWRTSVLALRSTLICIILCSLQVVIYTGRLFYFGKFGINKNARSFTVCAHVKTPKHCRRFSDARWTKRTNSIMLARIWTYFYLHSDVHQSGEAVIRRPICQISKITELDLSFLACGKRKTLE